LVVDTSNLSPAQLSQRGQLARAAWLAMDLTGWFVIVPLGCLALATGLIIASARRGLVRYYWVLIAFGLTSFALVILILHMPSVTATAEHAAQVDDAAAAQLGGDMLHPGVGLLVLVFVAVLNVYKPRGLTGFGQRTLSRRQRSVSDSGQG
jgi:cytochrome bd-type quinol oxidase subunit 2